MERLSKGIHSVRVNVAAINDEKYISCLNDEIRNPFHLISVAITNCLKDEFLGMKDNEENRQKMKHREKELLSYFYERDFI